MRLDILVMVRSALSTHMAVRENSRKGVHLGLQQEEESTLSGASCENISFNTKYSLYPNLLAQQDTFFAPTTNYIYT